VLAGTVEQLEVSGVDGHPVSYGTKAKLNATLRTVLTPVQETGLAGARLAARVQQAMHRIPEAELRILLGEIDRRARAERLVYLRDEVEDTIRVLATPIAALPDQLAYVRAVTLALHGALKRLPELYFSDPDVRAILSLPSREEAWLRRYWTSAVSELNTVVGRHDAAIDFGSPDWNKSLQFLEPNLGGIGGLHLIPTAAHILAEVVLPVLRAGDPELELESAQDIRALLMQDLLDHLEATGRTGRTVCFVEPKYAGYGPDEQGELARYIHAHFGIEVCHADPAELALDGDEVTYQGRVIDLVYRDYAVEDLLELEGEGVDVRPMQQAFATNRVVSSIAAELDQKSCWEVLGDPVLARRHFSSEERAFFRRHLPWTRLLRPGTATLPDGSRGDLAAYVLHARENLVLKPNRSYGGTGVAVGPVTGASEWKRLIEAAVAPGGERWVAQRLVSLPVCHFTVMDADGRLHAQPFYVVFGFAPSAYGLATLGRASQARVVNVAQRGGMCVIVVGHPPGQIVL
jgi:diaminobutyrate-2-oxoglutarate transaminase